MIQSDFSETIKQIRLSHEDEMARSERHNRRMWILCLVIFLAFVLSNCAWIVYESSFKDISVEQEVDTGDGSANVIGIGDYNGKSEAND